MKIYLNLIKHMSIFQTTLKTIVDKSQGLLLLASQGNAVVFGQDVSRDILRDVYSKCIVEFGTTLDEYKTNVKQIQASGTSEEAKSTAKAKQLTLYMKLSAYQYVLQMILFKFIKTALISPTQVPLTATNVATNATLRKEFDTLAPGELKTNYMALQNKYDELEKLKDTLQGFFNDSMASLESLSGLAPLANSA